MLENERITPIKNLYASVQGFRENGIARMLLPSNEVMVAQRCPLFSVRLRRLPLRNARVKKHRLPARVNDGAPGENMLLPQAS